MKLPFGIGQIGKAFRNEITPGNFIFRVIEFEQMEIEYFIREEEWKDLFDKWFVEMEKWCDDIGLPSENCHKYEHLPEKLSHYSKRTVDIEFDFPFGKKNFTDLLTELTSIFLSTRNFLARNYDGDTKGENLSFLTY